MSSYYDSDARVIMLADRGFSYRLISRITGLGKNQIRYILNKAGVKVSFYRNGENSHAKQVLKRMR